MDLPNKKTELASPGNNAPIIQPVSPVTVNEGETIEIQLQVSDPDGDQLYVSFRGWEPNGYSVDAGDPTHPIWRYQTGYGDAGKYSINLAASDLDEKNQVKSTVQRVVLISIENINRPPLCPALNAQSVAELSELELFFRASDPDAEDDLSLTYSFKWQGQMPSGVTQIAVDTYNNAVNFFFVPDFGTRSPISNPYNYLMEFSVTDASEPSYTVNCPIPLRIEDILLWEKAGDLPAWVSDSVVNSLVVDPFSSFVYAGISSFYDQVSVSNPIPDQGYGVYSYSPLGNSWTDVSAGLSEPRVLDLKIKPTLNQVYIFAATTAGIYRYDGVSWQEASEGIPHKFQRIFTLELDSRENIWAGPGSGSGISSGVLAPLYYSANEALSWSYPGGITDLIRVYDLASGGNQLLASVFRKSGCCTYYNSIIQSMDFGTTWGDESYFGHMASPSRVIVFDPADPLKIYVGADNQGIYRTVNGGATWLQPILIGTTNSYPRAILPIAHSDYPETVLVGLTEKGVWRSRDGGATYTAQNQGLPDGVAVRSIAVDPNNLDRIYIGTEYYGVYRTKIP